MLRFCFLLSSLFDACNVCQLMSILHALLFCLLFLSFVSFFWSCLSLHYWMLKVVQSHIRGGNPRIFLPCERFKEFRAYVRISGSHRGSHGWGKHCDRAVTPTLTPSIIQHVSVFPTLTHFLWTFHWSVFGKCFKFISSEKNIYKETKHCHAEK